METRSLFIDDHCISITQNMKRTMHAAEKYKHNPVIKPDRPWERQRVFAKNSVIFDQDKMLYRLWYNLHNSCYASSSDGIHWEKPDLGLVEYDGSGNNNLLGKDIFQIVYNRDHHEPVSKENTYKTISWNSKRGSYLLQSADGIAWKEGDAATIPGSGDTFVSVKSTNTLTGIGKLPGFLLSDKKYLGFVRWCCPVGLFDGSSKIKPSRRVQALVTSNDFLNWENPIRILTPDERDDQIAHVRIEEALSDGSLFSDCYEDRRCEFYTMFAFPYEDMYIGLLLVFYASYEYNRIGLTNQSGPGEIQLIASRDLIDWYRLGDRKPFIPKGKIGEFDWGMSWYCSLPIVNEDELLFYYTGTVHNHGGEKDTQVWQNMKTKIDSGELPGFSCIGLATLRRDGFVSLDAGNEPGFVMTKPISWPENGVLHINADASDGEIVLSLCQPDGTPYEGFEHSNPIKGNFTDCIVVWYQSDNRTFSEHTHGTAAEAPAAKGIGSAIKPDSPVRLKISAKNASIYSFWIT